MLENIINVINKRFEINIARSRDEAFCLQRMIIITVYEVMYTSVCVCVCAGQRSTMNEIADDGVRDFCTRQLMKRPIRRERLVDKKSCATNEGVITG